MIIYQQYVFILLKFVISFILSKNLIKNCENVPISYRKDWLCHKILDDKLRGIANWHSTSPDSSNLHSSLSCIAKIIILEIFVELYNHQFVSTKICFSLQYLFFNLPQIENIIGRNKC